MTLFANVFLLIVFWFIISIFTLPFIFLSEPEKNHSYKNWVTVASIVIFLPGILLCLIYAIIDIIILGKEPEQIVGKLKKIYFKSDEEQQEITSEKEQEKEIQSL